MEVITALYYNKQVGAINTCVLLVPHIYACLSSK